MWVRNAESNRPEHALVSVSSVVRARGRLIVVEAWILVAVVGRPLGQRRRRHDHHQCDSAEYRLHSRFSFVFPKSVNGSARRRFPPIGCHAVLQRGWTRTSDLERNARARWLKIKFFHHRIEACVQLSARRSRRKRSAPPRGTRRSISAWLRRQTGTARASSARPAGVSLSRRLRRAWASTITVTRPPRCCSLSAADDVVT